MHGFSFPAGSTSGSAAVYGNTSSAKFSGPTGIAHVTNAAGEALVYVADTGVNMVKVINLATGITATALGRSSAGSKDGAANSTASLLSAPHGLFLTDTELFWADTGNNLVRKVGLSALSKVPTGTTSRVRRRREATFRDGALSTATFGDPQGVAVSPSGDIFIAGEPYSIRSNSNRRSK
jgi:hypothetical protein